MNQLKFLANILFFTNKILLIGLFYPIHRMTRPRLNIEILIFLNEIQGFSNLKYSYPSFYQLVNQVLTIEKS